MGTHVRIKDLKKKKKKNESFALGSCTSGFLGGSVVKNPPSNAEDVGSVPGSGRSPGGGNGNPHQYSCLENSMDGRASRAVVYGVTKELDMTERLNTHPCCVNNCTH